MVVLPDPQFATDHGVAPHAPVATGAVLETAFRIPAIILVEDEPDILIILHRILRDLTGGYDIIPVHDGAHALAQLALRPVPLLITDYNMPEMTGVDLTRAVKAVAPETVVVLITAYGTAALERKGRAAGVDHYLTKPFALDHLEQIVRATLTARQLPGA